MERSGNSQDPGSDGAFGDRRQCRSDQRRGEQRLCLVCRKEAVSWLNFAFRLMQLPHRSFRRGRRHNHAAGCLANRRARRSLQFGPTLGKALRLAIFLTLPSAVGLYFLAQPLIGIIYERGEFRHADTVQTGLALQFYSLGLVAHSLHQSALTSLLRHRQKMDSHVREFCGHRDKFLSELSLYLPSGVEHRGLASQQLSRRP